jgi:hypothetical protein
VKENEMISGASSIKFLAGTAAVAGLIWARKALLQRGLKRQAAPGAGGTPMQGREDQGDEAAMVEALRDIRDLRQRRQEQDEAEEPQIEPEDIDELELAADVGYLDRSAPPDEPYDAVDAEDVGTEWLQRATQTTAASRQDPSELLEGTHGIESDAFVDEPGPSEAGYGSDQEGAPLAPHAGTHEDDVAAELPVGNVDDQGNTELHMPVNPPDALRAPPTGELAVSERELAARNEPPNPSRR